MKNLLSLILGVILIFSITACDDKKESNTTDKPTVKIGATLPLSGNFSHAGEAAQKILKSEVDKLNQQSLKYNYELIFEDHQLNSTRTALITNKLINVDKVKAIISMMGVAGRVIAPIADENAVFSFTNMMGEIATKGKYNFNIIAILPDITDLMATELSKRNIRDVALIIETAGGLSELRSPLEASLKKQNINIVFNEQIQTNIHDFRMLIAKAAEKKPQMYIMVGYSPGPYLFIKQLQEKTGNRNVTTLEAFGDIPAEQRHIAEGLWYIDSGTFGTTKFISETKNSLGIEPQTSSGAVAANLRIFVSAFENADVQTGNTYPTNDAVTDWIWKNVHNYDSPVGPVTVINDGLLKMMPRVAIIKNGKAVSAEE